jgi:hypothetical protein
MTDHQPPKSFNERLNDASKHMHSHPYFWLRSLGVGVATTILAALSVFVFSAVVFLWRERELGALPDFGLRGYSLLLSHFPWGPTVVFVLALLLLVILLHRMTPTYRWPVVFLLGFVVASSAVFGFLASRSAVHGVLANRAIRGQLPVFGRVYQPHFEDDHAVVGQIIELDEDDWRLLTPDGDTFTVYFTKETEYPQFYQPAIGDRIFVIGDERDDSIEADMFRPLPPPRGGQWP